MKLLLSLPILILSTACSGDGVKDDPPIASSNERPLTAAPRRGPPPHPWPNLPRASAVLAATPDGDLCAVDPDHGDVLGTAPAFAVDLIGSPRTPARAHVTEWDEQGGGTLVEVEVQPQGITRWSEQPLAFDDVRLLSAPSPLLALGFHEGTTLFTLQEGRSVFGVGSALAREHESGIDLWLLERSPIAPSLLHLSWEGSVRERSRTTATTPALRCPARLVRSASVPLLAAAHEGAVTIWSPEGVARSRLEDATRDNACVHDAVWLDGTTDVVVLTGPDARIHLLSTTHAHAGETLVLPGTLWHDPRPHRRIAHDPARRRVWLALSDRLVARRHAHGSLTADALSAVEGCRAESVTMVW